MNVPDLSLLPEEFVRDLGDNPALAALRWTEEIHPFVFRLPAFDVDACAELSMYLDRLRSLSDDVPPPNSMHEAGFALDAVGGSEIVSPWLEAWIRPLAAALYPEFRGGELGRVYGFVTDYGHDADQELGFHVDDAHVTVNLCLEGPSDGAELYFRGLRCELHRQSSTRVSERFELVHVPGTAILHPGPHRHGVHPILGGRRRNLILWCKAPEESAGAGGSEPGARRLRCEPWCGLSKQD